MSFGHPSRQTAPVNVDALVGTIGAAVLELPLRNLGWRLPDWADLTAMVGKLRDRGIAVHADAARLWEAQPYYDRPLSEIADLFNSLYVSFYKGLGAPAGAALAGPAGLIQEVRPWQQRAGATLHQLYPYVLAAGQGLDEALPRMPTFYAKARAIAEAIRRLPGIRASPDPPVCNSFQLVFDGNAAALPETRLDVAEATGIWPFERIVPSPVQGLAIIEVVVLDAAIAECMRQLSERLQQS